MTLQDYTKHFPFSTVRAEQQKAIDFALDVFLNQKKRFVILELGTGVGKSAIGVTLARYLAEHGGTTYVENSDGDKEETSGAYVLTTQKILQAQYMDDFGPDSGKNLMRSLKSANNYQCRFQQEMRCSDSKRLLKQLGKQLDGSDFQKCCRHSCPYTLDKQEFMDHGLGITNFSYFLAETMYAKQLSPRSLLVIDECHNIESELGKFVEVNFSERFARQLSVKIPKLDSSEAVIAWIKGPYKKGVQKAMKDLESKLAAQYNADGTASLSDMSKRYEMLDKHICKVNRFIETYNPDNWVMNLAKTPQNEAKGGRKFEFKPVDVSAYGHEHLYRFGSRVVLMSATVVDKDTFCKSVGIDSNDCAFLHIASPFPVKNRPIHYLGVGSMSKDNIDDTLPKMAATVKDLLELHKNDKGIIHCVNYKVAKFLVDNIKSPRLLLHDSENREDMIEFHMSSPDPTVLISPSMTEGVDLRDDASRFQILCKVPFPYLGDKVIQHRKQKNSGWYACQTARSVIQAFGRSIRNEKDHATSYILDSDWLTFFRRNAAMFSSRVFGSAYVGALTRASGTFYFTTVDERYTYCRRF
jgi:ATP-dependent DNA helicase DinG